LNNDSELSYTNPAKKAVLFESKRKHADMEEAALESKRIA